MFAVKDQSFIKALHLLNIYCVCNCKEACLTEYGFKFLVGIIIRRSKYQ